MQQWSPFCSAFFHWWLADVIIHQPGLWMGAWCVWVCVYLYSQGDSGQGRRKMRLPQHFSYPNWYLSSAQSGEHALGAWMFFHRSTAVSHIYSHVSEHTCLCQASSFPCPWTRFSGTCWEAGSHEEHKSYCLDARASTPKPQRGPALHSKKSNNSLFKNCHSFCLGLGPGSKVYRRFIIFQKYSLNDRKLSQCHLYGGSLLLPIVTGFPSGLDVPRKERKEKQRETEDGGGGREQEHPWSLSPLRTENINSTHLEISKLLGLDCPPDVLLWFTIQYSVSLVLSSRQTCIQIDHYSVHNMKCLFWGWNNRYIGKENRNVVLNVCIFVSSIILRRGRGIIVA